MAAKRVNFVYAAGLLALALVVYEHFSHAGPAGIPLATLTPAPAEGSAAPILAALRVNAAASAAPDDAAAPGTMDKRLASVKGWVSYEGPNQHPDVLVPHSSVLLSDRDYAMTGLASLGTVTLPDSSVVTIGSTTKVQLVAFEQAAVTKADFIIVGGSMRFSVHHPQGAAANYTFDTPTLQIAVRGTEGDISVDGQETHVNVYELSDPSLPVQVTVKKTGRRYTLPPGKTLAAHLDDRGRTIAELRDLSRSELVPFTGEFGQPRGVTPDGRPRRIANAATTSAGLNPHATPPAHPASSPRPESDLHPTPPAHTPPPHAAAAKQHAQTPGPHATQTLRPLSTPQAKATLAPLAPSPVAKATPGVHASARPQPHLSAQPNSLATLAPEAQASGPVLKRYHPNAKGSPGPKHPKPHATHSPHPKPSPSRTPA